MLIEYQQNPGHRTARKTLEQAEEAAREVYSNDKVWTGRRNSQPCGTLVARVVTTIWHAGQRSLHPAASAAAIIAPRCARSDISVVGSSCSEQCDVGTWGCAVMPHRLNARVVRRHLEMALIFTTDSVKPSCWLLPFGSSSAPCDVSLSVWGSRRAPQIIFRAADSLASVRGCTGACDRLLIQAFLIADCYCLLSAAHSLSRSR